jgi:hypothetical protein
MANSFTYKVTNESEIFSFDYSLVLDPAETIDSASCAVIVMNGTDPNPTAILDGAAVISGGKVLQRVYQGISEVTYRLVMTANTSYSNIYDAIGDLPVYDASLV